VGDSRILQATATIGLNSNSIKSSLGDEAR